MQKWTKRWTDEELYAKYGISKSEIAFIEKIVRPMNLDEVDDVEDVEDE
jgi:site-specific DNA-methyltransferase (adenine-specific)